MNTEELVAKFKKRMQPAVDYYQAFLWADADRHRLIGLEWVALKRAMKAEKQVEKLKKQLLDNGIQPE